ncbi:MAG: hypothetical protein PUA63_07510 [Oscillospiraceae bacterium]|nr:hypothetical protein [Oscillospiraceae bacterium]
MISSARGSLSFSGHRKNFIQKHIANFLSRKKAIQEGGMEIPVENGVLHNRTQGYACKDCNFVLIDCGKNRIYILLAVFCPASQKTIIFSRNHSKKKCRLKAV